MLKYKYYAQISQLLDEVLEKTDDKKDYEQAAWLKYNYILKAFRAEELQEPFMREFIQGIDQNKYPEISRYLWLEFLIRQFSRHETEESVQEIENEVFRYGTDLSPDVAELLTRVLFRYYITENPNFEKCYKRYQELILNAKDEETRKVMKQFDDELKRTDRKQYSWDKVPEIRGEPGSALYKLNKHFLKCKQLEDAMWLEQVDVSETNNPERTKQEREKIRKKYFPQMFQLLDGILENLDEDILFEDAVMMKYEYLRFVDEATCPNLRKFVLGFDSKKYPQIAHDLWIKYLHDRYYRSQRAQIAGLYEECVKEIEEEMYRYGKELPPDVADLGQCILNYESEYHKPEFENHFKQYMKLFSSATNIDTRFLFWQQAQANRRHLFMVRNRK